MLMAILLTAISCDNQNDKNGASKATLQVSLTDSPAEYDAVLIEIIDVRINRSDDENGWVSLDNVQTGIYDLLELTGGIDTLIALSEVDSGKIGQIRLVLGENNSVVIDGDTLSLNTPSAQQSGLKINVHDRLEAGFTYKLLLDFDAANSVVKAGNSGNYNLKPVIRAYFEAHDGAIRGTLANSVHAVVTAIVDTDSAGSFTDSTGQFFIGGLFEGVYRVDIDADSGWSDTTLTNIVVSNGMVTELGTITLSAEE